MRIVVNFAVKRVDELEPGELFEFEWSGDVLTAFRLRDDERPDVTSACVIRSSRTDICCPYEFGFQSDGCAKTFGTNWILELGSGGRLNSRNRPGVVSVRASGTTMLIGDGRPSPVDYVIADMVDFKFGRSRRVAELSSGSAVNVSTWRIWLSEAERARPDAKPFFEFSAE